MARTTDEVKASMKKTLSATDPSVDTDKGPVFDFLMAPLAPEVSTIESKIDRLAQLTSQQLGTAATTDELNALGVSFGIPRGKGVTSKLSNQYFITNTKPTSDIVIERGKLVSSLDSVLVYFVTEEVTLPASQADAFYNAATRTYEITAPIEAVAVGKDYDVASFSVRKILTPIIGIDRTENRDKISGGNIAEDNAAYFKRIQAKFGGLDPNSPGGIISSIKDYSPENISEVSLVYPKDRPLFKRLTSRPAIDAFVIGSKVEQFTETFVATANQVLYTPTHQPVDSIVSVTVNGTDVTAALVPDSDLTRNNSVRAQDKVQITEITAAPWSASTSYLVGQRVKSNGNIYVCVQLGISAGSGGPAGTGVNIVDNTVLWNFVEPEVIILSGDIVEIKLNHNTIISGLQTDLFSSSGPFETDVLVRKPYDVLVTVEIFAKILASFDPTRTSSAIESEVFSYVQPNLFITELVPLDLKEKIKAAVGGLSDIVISKFTKTSGGTLDVEIIEIEKNQTSKVDEVNLVIDVRR